MTVISRTAHMRTLVVVSLVLLGACESVAPTAASISAGFAACVHDRFNQQDLNLVPASCQVSGQLPASLAQPVGAALNTASTDVRHQNFLAAILYTLRFQLAAYLLCFLLVFLLPGRPSAVRPSAGPSA